MDYEKKIRFGGYNHPDYKYVREKLKRFWHHEEAQQIEEALVRSLQTAQDGVMHTLED